MGPLGFPETVFIFVLALLVFGPKKLPELGRTIGKAMTEFRRASSELKATFDREMTQIERENESLKDVTSKYALDEHAYNHDSYYDSGDYTGTYDQKTAG
jgi:TatA/E family protein of Tat protein translocase